MLYVHNEKYLNIWYKVSLLLMNTFTNKIPLLATILYKLPSFVIRHRSWHPFKYFVNQLGYLVNVSVKTYMAMAFLQIELLPHIAQFYCSKIEKKHSK